jgi:hypothetical protein
MPFTSTLGSAQVFEQTEIQVGTAGSAGSFQTIANIETLSLPLKEILVEVTNVGDHWVRRRPTVNDMGTIALGVFYVPLEPTHDNVSGGMLYMLINQVLADWQVVTPVVSTGSVTHEFPAYVSDFAITAKVKDVYHAAAQLANDGAPTIG